MGKIGAFFVGAIMFRKSYTSHLVLTVLQCLRLTCLLARAAALTGSRCGVPAAGSSVADFRLRELGLFEPRAAAALGSSWLVEHEKVLEVAARLLLWAEAMPTIPPPPEPLPFLMKKAIAALLLHSEPSSSPIP